MKFQFFYEQIQWFSCLIDYSSNLGSYGLQQTIAHFLNSCHKIILLYAKYELFLICEASLICWYDYKSLHLLNLLLSLQSSPKTKSNFRFDRVLLDDKINLKKIYVSGCSVRARDRLIWVRNCFWRIILLGLELSYKCLWENPMLFELM